jgi:type I restriction enzyme S subunit
MTDGWVNITIEEVAKTTSGGTPSRTNKNYYSGDILWVKSGELKDNYISDTEEKITEEAVDNSSAKLFPVGTVLIAMYGATVGKTAILRKVATTNQAVCGIIPYPSECDNEFLRFQLIYKREDFLKQRYGGAQPNISQTIIRTFELLLPPLPEQRKIAYVLRTIQKAIEQQDKLIHTTTELKKALMQKLFTEGINSEKQKQTEIGLVPESWEVVRFGNISEFKNGVNFSKEQKGEIGIPTIDVLNMYGKSYTIDTSKLYRVNKSIGNDYMLKTGDLLFVRSSLKLEGVGWTSLFVEQDEPITFCGFIIRARIHDKEYYPPFLTYYFRTEAARNKLISGSGKVAITNINQGVLNEIGIPKPSISEQEDIIRPKIIFMAIFDNIFVQGAF